MAHHAVQSFTILALYEFIDPKLNDEGTLGLKNEIEVFLRGHKARGAVLVSTEGINGTICYHSFQANGELYDREKDVILGFFLKLFSGLRTRVSFCDSNVFFRLRVRVKSEIVTMGMENVCPAQKVGEYVPPGPEWDKLLEDPDCLVIDTRNDYEYGIGTFKNAVNPNTLSFNELPQWLEDNVKNATKKPAKIAMFCTGGIRCEKSTSFALDMFKEEQMPIYHLEGGVLAYLDTVPPEQSLFRGECYVFDQRVAVSHGLKPTHEFIACHACRLPLSPQDRTHPDFKQGVQCGNCVQDDVRQGRRQRYENRHLQMKIHEKKGLPHIYDNKEVCLYTRQAEKKASAST
ncbi:hypothetical protein MPSEU_001070500 [Mayamaea pseudoterrestris]|nr:hypothetical protein MPSEU_001070500 [Mayamaea pseudoterrestris]